jgi:hypothetical protein
MTLEEKISIKDVKNRLRNVSTLMPNSEKVVHDFCSYLADNLPRELHPEKFIGVSAQVLLDLQCDTNGAKEHKSGINLVGLSSVEYLKLLHKVPDIASAVFPESFAIGVHDYFKLIRDHLPRY